SKLFVDYIKNEYKHVNLSYQDIDSSSMTEESLRVDTSRKEGHYLMLDSTQNTIKLLKKYEVEVKGFLYNSYDYFVSLIDLWELYQIADTVVFDQVKENEIVSQPPKT